MSHALRAPLAIMLSVWLSSSPTLSLPPVRVAVPTPAPGARAPQPITHPHKAGELIVKFRPEAPAWQKDQVSETFGKGNNARQELRGKGGAIKLKLKDNLDLATTIFNLQQLKAIVEWAEPNFIVKRTALAAPTPPTPNDPQFPAQWALANTGQQGGVLGSDIGAAGGWEKTTGSRQTVIAVIDTGVDVTHPDLAHNLWINQAEANGQKNQDDDQDGYVDDISGWNFVADNNDVRDDHGHGTQMAGIIAAEGNNAAGITGVMWQASLMPLKALDATGSGTITDVVEAMDFAIEHGAGVINCSFGTDGFSQAWLEAINRAAGAGALIVTAAGNSSQDLAQTPYYPASYGASNVIAVAATTNGDLLANFSNWGATAVQVAAPGIDILTTQRGGSYVSVTGTSAAAPLVAGVAGLLKTLRGWLSAQSLRYSLMAGARKVPYLAGKVSSGGVVNAGGAIAAMTAGSSSGGGTGGGGTGGGTSGGASGHSGVLDTVTTSRPNRPEPRVKINTLPPAGYDDPQPTQTANFNSYYTAATGTTNATGIAGSQPLQSADPTTGGAVAGGLSINLDSQNINFTTPVLSLKGRAGLDLALALSYNSRLWTKDAATGTMVFNLDKGFPGPGWRLGFGAIQGVNNGGSIGPYTNAVTGKQSFLFIAPDGTRRDLAYNPTSGKYESYDSTYMELNPAVIRVWMSNGLKIAFQQPNTANGDFQYLPTIIKDRNGNWIGIYYRTLPNNDLVMDYLVDTLGRRIDFVYQSNRLTAVQQNRNGTLYKYVTLDYTPVTIATNYGSLAVDPVITAPVYLPSLITYPTGHNLRFSYNSYGQVTQVEKWVPTVSGQGNERSIAYTHFDYWANYGQPWDDLPWFNLRSEVAEKWMGGAAQFYQYQFANRGGGVNAITDPVGISHRVTTSGLVQTLETIPCCQPAGYPTKTVRLEYTDDGLGYRSNPRLLEQKLSSGSIYTPDVRKTRYTYINANPSGLTPVWLPQLVDTYIGDSIVIYRRTNYSYQSYPDWHIYGLVKDTVVWNQAGYAASWTVNNYDETGSFTDSGGQTVSSFIDATADGAIQHDNYSYGASLVQRGNLTSVKQWWVANNQIGSQSRWLSRLSYDTNGNVRSVTDALGNRQQFTYTDYFSNQPAGVGQTAAYPYTAADPTGFRAGAQYDYYTGLAVRRFNLRPNSAAEEQGVTLTYDFADRPLVAYRPDGGYDYYYYWDNYNSLTLIQKHDSVGGQDIARGTTQVFDGAGRVERQSNPHPDGTIGKYTGQRFVYDGLGRRSQSSNVIAVYGDWTPTGENPLGWLYTTETFDEFSRPQVITRPDNNTRRYTFTNCGCSGGLTASVTDEKGQKTETVADFLGRLQESREYLANSTVIYSKAAYSYDELDRQTAITVISGAAPGQSQTRSFVYDGYGRVQSQTTPEGGTVTYAHYDNDQVQSVSDARGMVTTYSYNTRRLVTNVSYNDGGATPGVSYSYDEFGARSQMSDGMGATTYSYNSYRQLQSETRTFTGLPGESYSLSYGYNLVDQLKQVSYTATNFSQQINYARTFASTLSSIGTNLLGTDPNNTTNVLSLTGYRAFGAITGATYGNGRTLAMGYSEQRHQLTSMIVQKSDGSDRIVDKSYEYYDTNQANTGRLMKQTDHLDPAYSVTYYYDGVNRLYSAQAGSFDTVKGYDRTYSYDE